MRAIYKREVQSYFHTFIGFIFMSITLCFLGLYYTGYNLLGGNPYISYAVSSVVFIFFITIPILTMRSLSEERRNKSDQMILTAPVTVGKIVMGKFLALLTVFAVPTGIICIYPLILTAFGNAPLGEAYIAIAAFFLYGMACIAIGLFISSLTESQVIAAVISFGVLLLGYMMPTISSMIGIEAITVILSGFDLYTPFIYLISGNMDVTAIVYYLSITALFLFLTVQVIQKRRYSVSVKTLSVGAYSTGMIAIVVLVTIALNVLVGELPARWTSIDVTQQKLYTLTQQTKDYVKNMDEDVTIYIITNDDYRDDLICQTVEKYGELSDHITVQYVDPAVNPRFHTQYTSETITYNSIIAVSEKRSKVVDADDMYETTYTEDDEEVTTGYDGEGQITSALDYVLRDDVPKIYYVEGHGETTFSLEFKNDIKKENVEAEKMKLMDYEEVPADAQCLIINLPINDLSKDDYQKLIDYLNRGGNIITNAYTIDLELPNYEALLAYMGIEIIDGILVETDTDRYYSNPTYLLPEMVACNYTAGVKNRYYVLAPLTQGIRMDESATDITYNAFLTTTETAYAKMNINSETLEKEEGDLDGPFAVAVESVKQLKNNTATMVTFACSSLFSDDYSDMVGGANQTVCINAISNLCNDTGTKSVSVPVKSYAIGNLTITFTNVIIIGSIVTILIPLLCVITGFVIWIKRRRG